MERLCVNIQVDKVHRGTLLKMCCFQQITHDWSPRGQPSSKLIEILVNPGQMFIGTQVK